jgi:hypothetical protein
MAERVLLLEAAGLSSTGPGTSGGKDLSSVYSVFSSDSVQTDVASDNKLDWIIAALGTLLLLVSRQARRNRRSSIVLGSLGKRPSLWRDHLTCGLAGLLCEPLVSSVVNAFCFFSRRPVRWSLVG